MDKQKIRTWAQEEIAKMRKVTPLKKNLNIPSHFKKIRLIKTI